MVTLSKKSKSIVIAISVVALALAISMPYVLAASVATEGDFNQALRNLKAVGIAVNRNDGQRVKNPANFTLALKPAETNVTVRKFDVVNGTVTVNGAAYTITNGNGAALTKRHLILLQATGTDSNGQTITMKLAGRYFWMGGHLFVVRMIGRLQTTSGNFVLLMRAAIRI